MALPTQTNLVTMDYAYLGQPFVSVPAKSTIDVETMDYAYLGQPFVVNPFGGAPPSVTILDFERASMRGTHRGIMIGVG